MPNSTSDSGEIPPLPAGFRAAGVACGLKSKPGVPDVGLIVSDRPATAAGVYTQNQVCAAPVELDRRRTPAADMRGIVFNSGCANACTGEQGDRDALQMTELLGHYAGFRGDQGLVMSTGIIGHTLAMAKVEAGIRAAAQALTCDASAVERVSRALMTTDTYPKRATRSLTLRGKTVTITGFAKGAGMIGPNMATMLGVLLTDAYLAPKLAGTWLREIADRSFNAISVDGHTSTNDTLLFLANGATLEEPLLAESDDFRAWTYAANEVAVTLAKQIANDGEGATHLIEIRISGANSDADARTIASCIANSPLVKTAIAGADPNWGRIVSAAGYAPCPIDPRQTTLRLNGTLLFARGEPQVFDAMTVSHSIRSQRNVEIDLQVGGGPGTATFWTCDLTAEYVHINADYHT